MQSGRYLFATAPNGRETLGLWPALRQAAPRSRRGRGRGGAAATRQRGSGSRSVARQAPYGGPCGFVLHSLRLHPSGKGGAACLRDIPYGNVVSRWTLVDTPPLRWLTVVANLVGRVWRPRRGVRALLGSDILARVRSLPDRACGRSSTNNPVSHCITDRSLLGCLNAVTGRPMVLLDEWWEVKLRRRLGYPILTVQCWASPDPASQHVLRDSPQCPRQPGSCVPFCSPSVCLSGGVATRAVVKAV